MKYPIILKYKYSYICSGNYYKPAERIYYELFKNINDFYIMSLNNCTDRLIKIDKYSKNKLEFSYQYVRYLKPNTFEKNSELISEKHTLKLGEEVTIKCVETYWAYARGGENCPAELTVKWITYDELIKDCLEEISDDSSKKRNFAAFLLKEKQYDLAFEMLSSINMDSYELGLCYENGYGTEQDLTKALRIYLKKLGYDCERGIERVVFKLYKKRIKFDDVKKTILYEKLGEYQKAYASAIIPTQKNDNTYRDMRRSVELNVIKFLELGKPSNDPFYHPTHNMPNLAEYFDMINKVPLDLRPKYFEIITEDDIYDGGTIDYHVVHNDLIIETLQKEALKNDVIAIGALVVQFSDDLRHSSFKLPNINELLERLIIIGNDKTKDSGMAFYFLGLYYEYYAEKYNEKKLEYNSLATKYFELSLKENFHIAIAHLIDKIVEENKENALSILEPHEKFIPYIRYSKTAKYHDLLDELRGKENE